MRKRQTFPISDGDFEVLWDDFWTGLLSELASQHQFATRSHTLRPLSGSVTIAPSMGSTIVVTVPERTVTVATTIYSTTFVTIPALSNTVSGTSPLSASSGTQTSTISQSSHTSLDSGTIQTAPPSSFTEGSTTNSQSTTNSPSPTSTADFEAGSMLGDDSQPQTHKRAIIGGLSGTIAGLVLIGVLICIILRMRRKQSEKVEESSASMNEKGLRPALARRWMGLNVSAKGSPLQATEGRRSVAGATVDEENRIIRMNTRHWPRPYAPGEGEGCRESMPPGQLRVVNPDLSRPGTPRRSSETASNFLKKQRSALAGFVFTSNRSSSIHSHSRHQSLSPQQNVPTITIVDPTLSRECIAPYARTPSFRSYPSVSSLPVIVQQPPEDPFVTPLAEESSTQAQQQQSMSRLRRPSMSTLHSAAAGVASRTWSQLSTNFLHPFRPRSNSRANQQPVQNVRGLSHFSYSTNGSHTSRRSDPFDLDRPSIRGSHFASPDSRAASEFHRRSVDGDSNWILYEGT